MADPHDSPTPGGTIEISLITSLYRAAHYLPRYCEQVLAAASELHRAGLPVEIILIANDASDDERLLIGGLQVAATGLDSLHVKALFVERETVYASWNRGIAACSGRCIGVWGVDDSRNPAALIEGARLIREGCQLVDFPFVEDIRRRAGRLFQRRICRTHCAPFDPDRVSPKAALSPFFLMSRTLYAQAGPFDERFRVAGDFEWSKRAVVRAARYCAGSSLGGTFLSHGGNLSGGVRNQREWAEHNVVLLMHQQWDSTRPVEPALMRAARQTWEQELGAVPQEIAERLWGRQADHTWAIWQRDRRREQVSERVRWLPRLVMDTLGLRPALAKLGIVQPARKGHSG